MFVKEGGWRGGRKVVTDSVRKRRRSALSILVEETIQSFEGQYLELKLFVPELVRSSSLRRKMMINRTGHSSSRR